MYSDVLLPMTTVEVKPRLGKIGRVSVPYGRLSSCREEAQGAFQLEWSPYECWRAPDNGWSVGRQTDVDGRDAQRLPFWDVRVPYASNPLYAMQLKPFTGNMRHSHCVFP